MVLNTVFNLKLDFKLKIEQKRVLSKPRRNQENLEEKKNSGNPVLIQVHLIIKTVLQTNVKPLFFFITSNLRLIADIYFHKYLQLQLHIVHTKQIKIVDKVFLAVIMMFSLACVCTCELIFQLHFNQKNCMLLKLNIDTFFLSVLNKLYFCITFKRFFYSLILKLFFVITERKIK